MDISNISGLTDITNENAESIFGGFRFENYDDGVNLLSTGVVGSLNQRVRGFIADNVRDTVLESEEFRGLFRVEIPSLGFNRVFEPNSVLGVILTRGEQIPFALDGNTEVFVTDLGAPRCRPTVNPTCRRPDNSSRGAGASIIVAS